MAEFTETVTKTVNCPYCSSKSVVKNGRREDIQRYQCKGCGKRFTTTGKVHGHRFTSDQIGAAIRQFYSGTSYKQIAEYLEEVHDLPEPSKRTIYQWVKEYTDTALTKMEEHQAQTSGQWVADEMQVTVGGEKYWNWNVMDKGTRYLLASHLSKERDARAATAVFKKALAAADGPPKSVTTDKLRSYIKPIKDMLPDATHIQSQGLRAEVNNNLSERVQGTFRQRTKTLRGWTTKRADNATWTAGYSNTICSEGTRP